MPVPTWTVEIAFASTPLATAPTWVDVTQYVLTDGAGPGIRIERGRSSPLDDFRTGRASFRLLNTSRIFDPLHASGPYFGNLLPGKQVRIRATANAVTTDQFRGFIRGWPQSFDDAGYWAYVDVECYDGLGWLSEARVPGEDLVLPYARDTIGSLQLFLRTVGDNTYNDASSNGRTFTGALSWSGASAFRPRAGASMLAGSAPSDSVQVPPGAVLRNTPGWSRLSGAWSISLWVRYTYAALGFITLTEWTDDTGRQARIEIDDGRLFWRDNNAFTAGGYLQVPQRLNDDAPHHVVVTGSGSADPLIYIDGVLMTPTRVVEYGANLARFAGLNAIYSASESTVQDVAAWNVQLTAAQVAELYARSLATFTESTTARAGRILDAVGWPSAWRDLTSTPYGTCTSPPFNGAQAANLLRDVEHTEQGRLFVAKDGDVTLLSRYYTTNVTRGSTIQATFSDDGADIAYQAGGYTQEVDDVLNAVTVSLVSGASSESTDSASITTYGRKSDTINTLLPNLDVARDMARGVVLQRKDVLTRIQPVEPALELTAANWATVLGLEIGDRVRLEMTPSRTGSQLQQSATVEGITIEAHLSHTRASFEASPLPAVSWFVVGTSTVGGTGLIAF